MIQALQNCTSREAVVELINDEFATDATAEEIAAEYALDAIKEAETETCDITIDFHLDFLVEDGANFDKQKALEIALKK